MYAKDLLGQIVTRTGPNKKGDKSGCNDKLRILAIDHCGDISVERLSGQWGQRYETSLFHNWGPEFNDCNWEIYKEESTVSTPIVTIRVGECKEYTVSREKAEAICALLG